MKTLLKSGNVFSEGKFHIKDVLIDGGIVSVFDSFDIEGGDIFFVDCSDLIIIPGLVDVHVHLREPGFLYKETIKTGTQAAAAGGYTTVCPMPNLNPPPDSMENLRIELEAIAKDAVINVIPFGTITKGQKGGGDLSDMEDMAPYVAGFSDDGKGVQKEEKMLEAMTKAKELGRIISAHCEDESLLNGGYIHDGEYAKAHGHRGICSESEWGQVKRDIELVRKTGCKYHVCHVSAKETVDIIRSAKKDGLDVSCETGPHYLTLTDMDLKEEGRFKMNPPLRSAEDRKALIEGIKDGTIEIIATDHAPHSAEEKSKGLEKSAMGIVGLETAFPVLYTKLVKPGIISLEKLIELMSVNPARRFGFDCGIETGKPANLTVIDLNEEFVIDSGKFLSKGRATPFDGMKVSGKVKMTFAKGELVYKSEN